MVIFGIWFIQKLKIAFKLDNVRKIIFKYCFFLLASCSHIIMKVVLQYLSLSKQIQDVSIENKMNFTEFIMFGFIASKRSHE